MAVLLMISLFSQQHSQAAPVDSLQLANDSGVMGQGYNGLSGSRTLAVRLDFGQAERPIRVDSIEIYMAPQENASASFPVRVRLERPAGTGPGGEMITSKAVRLAITEAGWYSIPIDFIYPYNDSALVISLKSEDSPWSTPPLIGLDDSVSIPRYYNYYGEDFDNWVEHYAYWPDPETIGNLMIRVTITTGDDVNKTPTATPLPPGSFIELGAGQDAYLMQNLPDTNFGQALDLRAGYNPGTGELQVLVGKFPTTSLPANATIIRADLALHINETPNGAPDNLRAYALTGDWLETDVTFDSGQSLWGQAYGDGETNPQQPGWMSFDVTQLVQAWVDGVSPAYGIGIHPADISNRTQFVVFDAHEVAYLGPRLRIHYVQEAGPSLYLPLMVTP